MKVGTTAQSAFSTTEAPIQVQFFAEHVPELRLLG